MSVVISCHQCAVGVANDDWTALDSLSSAAADALYRDILEKLATLGWLEHLEHYDAPRALENGCHICGDTIWEGRTIHIWKRSSAADVGYVVVWWSPHWCIRAATPADGDDCVFSSRAEARARAQLLSTRDGNDWYDLVL